jgi:hypothetical protein
MEYFQIEERFGARPHPKLQLYLEPVGFGVEPFSPGVIERWFVLGIKNVGTGIAKFPSIRYLRSCGLNIYRFGIDGNNGFPIPTTHP